MTIAFASQHTTTLPALLRQLGVSVLVSTYQAGQVIILRDQGATLNTHFYGMDRPMGMAADREKLAVGAGYQVWELRNMPAVAAKLDPPGQHDACYLPREIHVTGDIDIHEMAYGRDGQIWLINTRMSCLCALDRAHSVVPRWRPPFIGGYDLTDRCHLNGLALRDGEPAFATALGESDVPAGWRADKARGGILMDIASGQIVARGLSMPHSPRWYRDRLWVLESGAGRLGTLNPKTGRPDVVAELPGFTRGLDFVGDYAFVGLSQVRETAVFGGLPLTERVAERHCGVWVVDIVRRQIVAYVIFTGEVREIFAVQTLPSRFPTLLELDNPLLRTSYMLPDEAFQQVAPADPTQLGFEKAVAHHQRGALDAAIAGYRELLAAHPNHLPARQQLGVALADAERWTEAGAELQRVIEQQPRHAEAHNSLGLCRQASGDLDGALDHFERAIAADRQYAAAHFNRGLLLLKRGDYRRGWEEFDWRWQLPGFTPFRCPQPRWRGEDIGDKTLLVHTEQGAGDALQFARFLPLAAQRCRKLLLVCPEPLRALLGTVAGVAEVRLPGALPADSFDVYCPLLGLPRVLDIALDNLPAQTPYLGVPAHVAVPPLPNEGRRNVGLVWAGSATQKRDRQRSCPLPELLPLFDCTGVAFYSLQTPVTTADAALLESRGIIDLEPELTDYARTAAYVQQLDLVISVCTSVAHLAGALNKPVWVLLPHHADWLWLEGRDDSPWYPSARLFRQTVPGGWSAPVARARRVLQEWSTTERR